MPRRETFETQVNDPSQTGEFMTQSWLNYHHLYYFKVIATEGSIAKASKTLRLGQPTLSAQLKLLEDVIGQKLFERQNRRLILTDAGRVALDYANEIFRLGSELLDTINQRPVQGCLEFHYASAFLSMGSR